MIRIVTRTRLVTLQQEAKQARARSRDVQASADAAYARHVRTAWNLTAAAEAAEGRAEEAFARTQELRQALDRANADLYAARATAAEQAARIDALTEDLSVMCGAVALLNHGQLHSVHRDQQAAERHAASFGVGLHGWGPTSDLPASEVVWRISPLSKWAVTDGGDAG
ncbi:hypothetical protein OG436_13230 [Streptomyces caniferus]|uniref:hypothetical protein n=1 Tax=Streptomyces caniferus TaxID=285557 RepID=UPI002E2B908D|nr:hypothetical protein [Streptomyces caniferus]